VGQKPNYGFARNRPHIGAALHLPPIFGYFLEVLTSMNYVHASVILPNSPTPLITEGGIKLSYSPFLYREGG
jgi:hypothetical protein